MLLCLTILPIWMSYCGGAMLMGDSVWLYYSGRGEFKNLDRFMGAFTARYGESDDLETFLLKNQISSYEAIRPMFEAFAVNKFHSTGVVQWMYNSAWPTLDRKSTRL